MLNRWGKSLILMVLLCMSGQQLSAQSFSPDGKQILFPRYDPQGIAMQAIVNTDGTGLMEILQSVGCPIAKWSPNGKYILLSNAKREVKIYTLKTGKTQTLTHPIEPPFVWREDSSAFAGVLIKKNKFTQIETRELCRFDREGYPMGRVPLHDLQLASQAPLYWIPNTDELVFMTNEQAQMNVYVTDSMQLRKVSSSNDLVGMGQVTGTTDVIWARKGANLHYILMTLYRFNTMLTSVSRLNFPERLPPLNPDPRHAPDSIFSVKFSPDGSHLIVIALMSEAGKKIYRSYTLKIDGSEVTAFDRYATPPDFLYNWSPDGKQLTWMWGMKLMIGNVDGTNKVKIFTN